MSVGVLVHHNIDVSKILRIRRPVSQLYSLALGADCHQDRVLAFHQMRQDFVASGSCGAGNLLPCRLVQRLALQFTGGALAAQQRHAVAEDFPFLKVVDSNGGGAAQRAKQTSKRKKQGKMFFHGI